MGSFIIHIKIKTTCESAINHFHKYKNMILESPVATVA